jgi:hypothetical protein
MNLCIFHIGIHKTGTSSIQESLHHGLDDRSFRYFGFGETNGNRGITTLFGDPRNHYQHFHLGLTETDVETYRRKWMQRLGGVVQKVSGSGRTLVISAEDGWLLNEGQLGDFRRFMEDGGTSVRAVAYIRPWKSRIESGFTQRYRTGFEEFQASTMDPGLLDYRRRIEILDRVFGPQNVQIFKYDPATFPEGCVVRHFCLQMGIRFRPERIRMTNESLSLPALRLLYTYRKLGPGFGSGYKWLILDWILMRRLSELKGPPLRFHSSLAEPLMRDFEDQVPWLRERLGFGLEEDIHRYDGTDCIRQESDLFRYHRDSLEWLASATGSAPAGEPAEVARQVHVLRTRPSLRTLSSFIMESGGKSFSKKMNDMRIRRI